jgi:hypothetical protein
VNTPAFLRKLKSLGVTVELDNDGQQLDIEAPRGLLTPKVLSLVREHKPAIIQMRSQPPLKSSVHSATKTEVAHAESLMRVANAFAAAVPLKRNRWRIDGAVYSHAEALLLVAHKLGTTANGCPVSFDAGAAYREHQSTFVPKLV